MNLQGKRNIDPFAKQQAPWARKDRDPIDIEYER